MSVNDEIFPTDRLCKSDSRPTDTKVIFTVAYAELFGSLLSLDLQVTLAVRSNSSNDSPRFFKDDIISILREKNELKERVIELEEEVEVLKRYASEKLILSYFKYQSCYNATILKVDFTVN